MINLKDKKDCCGCSACYNICPKKAISMQEDIEGFLYPIIDNNKCVKCNLCIKVCPILNNKKETKLSEVYGCKNKNVEEPLIMEHLAETYKQLGLKNKSKETYMQILSSSSINNNKKKEISELLKNLDDTNNQQEMQEPVRMPASIKK